MPDEYLTAAEVGALLKLHPRTILRLAAEDATMPVTRFGRIVRFERSALDRWLTRARRGSK
jgi:excisionase family DNA binding protein